MKSNFGKILRGDRSYQKENHSGYKLQIQKIEKVWNGLGPDEYGVLRVFRLSLVTLLIFFPGVLIDELYKSKTSLTRKIIVELYVLLKSAFPLFVLNFQLYKYNFVYYLCLYLLAETYIYLFSKIFLGEHHVSTSNMRTLLLLIFNFFESALTFAVIYISGNYLNVVLQVPLDAIYYSFVTSATIGFGDIHPVTSTGKLIAIIQIISSVSFIVLFFNFFSGKANHERA